MVIDDVDPLLLLVLLLFCSRIEIDQLQLSTDATDEPRRCFAKACYAACCLVAWSKGDDPREVGKENKSG
jgi:hypothetical protein